MELRLTARAVRFGARASLVAAIVGAGADSASQASLIVAGSPEYDSTTSSGLRDGGIAVAPGSGVGNTGTAVGYAQKYVSGNDLGTRAVRWDASGLAATELGHLGTKSTGYTYVEAAAVNTAGTAVGYAERYVSGIYYGNRAVRWDAGGTSATELGNLGTDSGGYTSSNAYAINAAGTAVGSAYRYDSLNNYLGARGVRWDASGTTATELGYLGTSYYGVTNAEAYGINATGTAVGYAQQYVGGNYRGTRAVRWNASGTAATELGHLGTNSSGSTNAMALAVNDSGTAVGYAARYSFAVAKGDRAVRWGASGVATELGNLGTNSSGYTMSQAWAVNESGTAVGYAYKYDGTFTYKGFRAVRWDASGTAATELANLGTDSDGNALSYAFAVNVAGTAVGRAGKYDSGIGLGDRAVIWLPDASVIDLNDLGVVPNPAGGSWVLEEASALSADGWVAGSGTFTPATGSAYERHWVAQVGLGGTWTGAFSGSLDGTWGRGRQWSTGTPAMSVGDAVFLTDASYTVTLDRNESTRSITIGAGHVTLNFDGYSLAAENVSIAQGATLSGTGTIIGDVTLAGTLEPGSSPGTLVIDGDLTQTGSGVLRIEIAPGPGGSLVLDQLVVTGTANLGGQLVLDFGSGVALAPGSTFDFLFAGGITGAFQSLDVIGLDPALTVDFDLASGSFIVAEVPEPGSLAALVLGAGLLIRQRRRGCFA